VASDAEAAVFISYSHADAELARRLAKGLRDRGIRVWIDEGELKVGDSECYAKPSTSKIYDLGSCTSERCSKIISESFA
jgi:hypothetical protein